MHHFLFRSRNLIQFLSSIKQESNPITTYLRFIHKSASKTPKTPIQKDSSLTVSYLINSCGLSPSAAMTTAKKINMRTTETPDRVLDTLKSYGFTETHIPRIITKCPGLLLSYTDKSIKPKLDYFISLGYSGNDLTTLVTSDPYVLLAGLKGRIKPNFDLLLSIFDSDRQVIAAIRRSSSWLLSLNFKIDFLPNIKILQSCGVPPSNIAKLAAMYPRTLMQNTVRFESGIERIMKTGLDPQTTKFLEGIAAVMGLKPSTWDRKMALYKSLGWSEGQVISAFRCQPKIMLISDKKLKQVMDFFVNKMQLRPLFLVKRPVILCLSLEKRIIPRYLVMSILSSKGLVSEDWGAHSFLKLSDKRFVERYVSKHADRVPEVLDALKCEREPKGFGVRD